MLNSRPFLIILSAPSGAGKTTLCRALVRHDSRVRYSVSATTRPRRGKEVDGVDYHFMTDAEFDELVGKRELVEWEEVYGYRYGTLRAQLEEFLDAGFDVVLALDIKGALNIKKCFPESVTVFLLPPSMEELRRRLTSRAREEAGVLAERLALARTEMERAFEFDYVVVNDSLAESIHLVTAILRAERSRSTRLGKIEISEVI